MAREIEKKESGWRVIGDGGGKEERKKGVEGKIGEIEMWKTEKEGRRRGK